MSAREVIEVALYEHQYVNSENRETPKPPIDETWCCAVAVLDALKANGYVVVKVPVRNVSDADCSGACWGGE